MPDTLWPFRPSPEITEVVESGTDLIAAHAATWTTARHVPRHRWRMRFNMDNATWRAAVRMIEANVNGRWIVPIWPEGTDVTLDAGQTVIACDTNGGYLAGGQAVIGSGCGDAITVDIDSVSPGQVTLAVPLAAGVLNGRIMPARLCYARGGFGVSGPLRGYTALAADFVSDPLPDFAPSALSDLTLFPEYLGAPVLICGDIRDRTVSGNVVREARLTDSMMGQIAVFDMRDITEVGVQFSAAFTGPVARWQLVRLLHWLRGRDRLAWVAEIGGELTALSYDDVSVTCAPSAFGPGDVGGHMAIAPGVFREITSVSGDGSVAGFSASPPATRIERVRMLRLARVSTDSIQLAHHMDHAVQVTLPMAFEISDV